MTTTHNVLLFSPVRGLIVRENMGAPGLIVERTCVLGPHMPIDHAITDRDGVFSFDAMTLPWPCKPRPDLHIAQRLDLIIDERIINLWACTRKDQQLHSENKGRPLNGIWRLDGELVSYNCN